MASNNHKQNCPHETQDHPQVDTLESFRTPPLAHRWGCLPASKKIAHNILALASKDRKKFSQPYINISQEDTISLFTPKQSEKPGDWMVMPRDPGHVLTICNAVLVKKSIRSYLLCEWKKHKDIAAYKKKMDALLASVGI